MSENNIICPHCQKGFSISDIASHELQKTLSEKQKEIEAEEKRKAFAWAKSELEKSEKNAKEKLEAEQKLRFEKEKELENLKKVEEESKRKDLELQKNIAELERVKKESELEKEKAIFEERKKIEGEIAERLGKESEERIKLESEKIKFEQEKELRQKDQQIEQMKKSLEDLNRKASQGSMQIQGEINEDALKRFLSENFPLDQISDVEKGIKGADLVQEVSDDFGNISGTIVWESKNTKAWSDDWVVKLKEDRLRVNAHISIIVSQTLPNGIKHFGKYKDIWVTSWDSLFGVTIALREQLISLKKMQNSMEGKDQKMEMLYSYLASHEFKNKIENIVEAFADMQKDLESEKAAFERVWAKREKQLKRVISNTTKLYGDFEGLIGGNMQKIDYFEGPFLEEK